MSTDAAPDPLEHVNEVVRQIPDILVQMYPQFREFSDRVARLGAAAAAELALSTAIGPLAESLGKLAAVQVELYSASSAPDQSTPGAAGELRLTGSAELTLTGHAVAAGVVSGGDQVTLDEIYEQLNLLTRLLMDLPNAMRTPQVLQWWTFVVGALTLYVAVVKR